MRFTPSPLGPSRRASVSPRPRLAWSIALAACASPSLPRARPVVPTAVVVAPDPITPPALPPAESPLPAPYTPPQLPIEQLQPLRELTLPPAARRFHVGVIAQPDGGFVLHAPGWIARYDRLAAVVWQRSHRPVAAEIRQAGATASQVGDVLVQQEGGTVLAYDVQTGAVRWRIPIPAPTAALIPSDRRPRDVVAVPQLQAVVGDDDTLVLTIAWAMCFADLDGCHGEERTIHVLGLARSNGARRWQQVCDETDPESPSGPLARSETFLVVPSHHALAANLSDGVALFDLATGQERWRTPGDLQVHTLLGDRLLVERSRRADPNNEDSARSQDVLSLDLATGTQRGAWPLRADAVHWQQVDDGVALVQWQNDDRAGIDEVDVATGSVRARTPLGEIPRDELWVEGDVFSSPEIAFDRRDGRVRWRWSGLRTLAPIDGGRAFVGVSLSHRVMLFARSARPPPPDEDVTLTGRLEDWHGPEQGEFGTVSPDGLTIAANGTFRAVLRARGELSVHVCCGWRDAVVRLNGTGRYNVVLRLRE